MIKATAQHIRAWLQKYERPLIAASLLTGFLIDNWLLTGVDVLWNNLLLGSYLLITAAGIAIFHMVEEHTLTGWKAGLIGSIMPIIIQFSFGNLFSGLIIFYSRSAEIATSWLFVLLLAGLIIFSEAFGENYRRFRYQISIWFFLLLSYTAFFLPVITGVIGPLAFLLGVAVSIGLLAALIVGLKVVLPRRIANTRTFLTLMTMCISAAFVVLYALNWIPPLPLGLKEASVAHSVVRTGDSYVLSVEPKDWWQWYARYHAEYHYTPGEVVYAYSSVFVPTKLDITIVHEWQRYNEISKEWETRSTVSFPARGGRDGGYRGYSLKSNLEAGKWRVNVKTDYGAIIGRITFVAVLSDVQPELVIEEH